jgi:hypothetical protein
LAKTVVHYHLVRFETHAEKLFFSAVIIEGQGITGAAWTGTGFVCSFRMSDGRYVELLVTNKHVVDGAVAIKVRYVLADESGDAPTDDAHTVTIAPFTATSFVGHPDPNVDVAVMFWRPIVDAAPAGRKPFFVAVHSPLFLDEDLVDQLDAIEGVTFIGFPSGIYDTQSWLPVARRGQTATPIENDYRGEPTFLIDAAVFPGSSGSPVFLLDRAGYIGRDGQQLVSGWRVALLGIVAAVHQSQVQGSVTLLPAADLLATVHVPMGLGIVYKARTIIECANLILAPHGLRAEQTPYDPSAPWGE